jgi:hypothetical protein
MKTHFLAIRIIAASLTAILIMALIYLRFRSKYYQFNEKVSFVSEACIFLDSCFGITGSSFSSFIKSDIVNVMRDWKTAANIGMMVYASSPVPGSSAFPIYLKEIAINVSISQSYGNRLFGIVEFELIPHNPSGDVYKKLGIHENIRRIYYIKNRFIPTQKAVLTELLPVSAWPPNSSSD